MPKINLRDFYPFGENSTIEVSDEIIEVFQDFKRQERNYKERVRWNRAYYSLNIDGGAIENDALHLSLSSEATVERKQTMEALYAALNSLPDNQRRRVYAHYILGIPQAEVAKTEGVAERNIRYSISKSIQNLKKFLLGVS